MPVVSMKAIFSCDVQTVWDIVTSLTDYAWRSDLAKIECVGEKEFIEYTKDGFATTFTIKEQVPCERWEFDMENDNMKGHWVGVFSQKDGQTEIDFTEDVSAKKLVMKPFVGMYLKRQQAQYVADLKKAIEGKV